MFNLKKKNCLFIFFIIIFLSKNVFSSDYNEIIEKVFSNKKLENIEGIWTKTLANEGPAGCVTMFYKDQNDYYYQMHIDQCFVMGKITGKQKKLSDLKYEGENAVYFFNGDVNWGASSIEISKNLNNITITHNSHGNYFREEWKRIWPKDIQLYNNQNKD